MTPVVLTKNTAVTSYIIYIYTQRSEVLFTNLDNIFISYKKNYHFALLRSLQADRFNLGMTPLLHGTLGFLKYSERSVITINQI